MIHVSRFPTTLNFSNLFWSTTFYNSLFQTFFALFKLLLQSFRFFAILEQIHFVLAFSSISLCSREAIKLAFRINFYVKVGIIQLKLINDTIDHYLSFKKHETWYVAIVAYANKMLYFGPGIFAFWLLSCSQTVQNIVCFNLNIKPKYCAMS